MTIDALRYEGTAPIHALIDKEGEIWSPVIYVDQSDGQDVVISFIVLDALRSWQ